MYTLDNFDNIEVLWWYMLTNVKSIPIDKDDEFIFPEKLLNEKIGNCIDIAFTLHMYCELKNIENHILNVEIEYPSDHNQINSFGHVVCVFKNPLIYNVGNISAVGNILPDELFVGSESLDDTCRKFGLTFLPIMHHLYNLNRVNKYTYWLLSQNHIDILHNKYYNNDVRNKQKTFHNFKHKEILIKQF